MLASENMLQRTLENMFPDDSSANLLIGDLDEMPAGEVFEALETSLGPVLGVAGDWRRSPVDVYDIVIRFAEERYAKMRHQKFPAGMYVVVMGEPLEDFPIDDGT